MGYFGANTGYNNFVMPKDPMNRKRSEALLSLHLRKAEEETLRDPEIRKMVDQLRQMYHDDQEGIFTAFAVTAQEDRPSTKKDQPTPPPSKIPQLLLMLSELSDRTPEPPSAPHPRDPQPIPTKGGVPTAPPRPASKLKAPEDDRQRELMQRIEETKKELASIKKEEHLVRAKKGKYGLPAERLKAERMLRELPGQITHMEHTLLLMQEGIL